MQRWENLLLDWLAHHMVRTSIVLHLSCFCFDPNSIFLSHPISPFLFHLIFPFLIFKLSYYSILSLSISVSLSLSLTFNFICYFLFLFNVFFSIIDLNKLLLSIVNYALRCSTITPTLCVFVHLLSSWLPSLLLLSFLSILFSHSHCSSSHSFPFSSLTVIAHPFHSLTVIALHFNYFHSLTFIALHFIHFPSLTAILESNFTGEPCPVQAYIPSKIEQSSMDKWTSLREHSNFIHRGYSSKELYIHYVLFIVRGCANVVCFFVYLILYLAPLMRDY